MADAMERRYSAMFIYNKPWLSINRNTNPDYVLSYKFVKFAVDKMATWGFDDSYYHERNATPGSDIFDELFETVDASRFIVVLCTRGFLTDAWGKYISHATFAKLLNQSDSKRFIAIHINLKDQQIPEAFNTMIGLSFSANWQNEHEEWEKFRNILVKVKQPVPTTGADVVPLIRVNPSDRGNYQHLQTAHVRIQAISGIETDGETNEPSEINSTLQSVNQYTTNRSDNGNPLNQQSGAGNQHNLAEMQSNYSSVIYQRNSTHGLDSNTAASKSPTMQTSGNREPPDGAAPSINSQNSSDTNLKEIVGRDTEDEDYPSSSLNRNDVEPVYSGQSISNSTDNQVSTDSVQTETTNSQVYSQQPYHTKRSRCPKGGHSNSQHDFGYDQGLDLQSVLSDHKDTNGSNTESIGIHRVNDYSALLPNNGYESMDGPATNTQDASLLSSTMQRILPAAISTMKNIVGTTIKSVIFGQKCDQSFI